jgi:hypothetical protein
MCQCLHNNSDVCCADMHFNRGHVDKFMLLENMDQVYLTLDELVDAGTIMEIEGAPIVSRVSMSGTDGAEDVPIHEQSLSQAFASAKQQFARTLLK